MATVKGALTAGGPEIKRAHAKLKGKDKNGKVENWWYYSLEVDKWDVVRPQQAPEAVADATPRESAPCPVTDAAAQIEGDH